MTVKEIFKDMCRVVLIGTDNVNAPASLITDMDELRSIAPLFKEAA